MKSFLQIALLLLLPTASVAQQFPYWEVWNKAQADSLQLIWNNTSNDTLRMGISRSVGVYYVEIELDSALYYFRQELALARKLDQKLWEADALDNVGYVLSNLKDYPGSLQVFLSAIMIAEDEQSERNIWQISRFSLAKDPTNARLTILLFCHLDLGRLYSYTGNVEKQLSHRFEGLRIAQILNDPSILSNVYSNLGKDFTELNKLDSALMFLEKSIYYYDISGFNTYKGGTLSCIGLVYFKNGNYALAKQYFTKAVHESRQVNNLTDLSPTYLNLGDLFSRTGDRDSSLWYAYKGLESAQLAGSPGLLVTAYTSLSSNYKSQNNVDSAFFYQSLALSLKDSINNIERINQFQNIGMDEQLRVQELEKENISYQNKIRTNTLAGSLFTLIVIAVFLYRNSRQKQKAKQNIDKAYDQLKSTQSQLIQSEKMASLGELTAGIAHEIQNPLNFVNNFSEVSNELIKELQDIRHKAQDKNANADEDKILDDIAGNLDKINHHGKRAADIVKGMLQHSRTSSGTREPTDLNALADEYLRLAYHGLRAKDKSFSADFKADLDPSLPKVNVIPQDIGRVILNLINNAYYAVSEKSKKGISGYEPTVIVKTKRLASPAGGKDNLVEIRVKDNGDGIPDGIVNKIFQPFFTTKPTGQGTGLGLSLSYDIITKGHNGTLEVDTTEGVGTEFIIQLPIV